jgi:hypothetical protein
MRSSDVTFRRQAVDIVTRDPNDDDKQEMDIIEIRYPDGKVVAFPADMKSPETGVRYRDMFPAKYKAFKNGEPDPDRVSQLEREIEERKAELDAMRNQKKAPDAKPAVDPKRIEQPTTLVKPASAVAPAKPSVDPKAKEPA